MRNPNLSIPGLFWGTELASDTKHKYEYIFLDGNTDGYVPFETLAFKVRRLVKVGIKILQSCNGLLLCGNVVSRNYDRTYYIFNPFTKQYKLIPPSPIRSCDFPYLMNVSLVFDPSKSPYYKVISFWSSRDISAWKNIKPEVVEKRSDLNSTKFRIEIYDSETSSWGLSGFDSCTPAAKCILWGGGAGIFWNRRLYWCNLEGYMTYFDVDLELVVVVSSPSSDEKSFEIAEFGGHFYLTQRDLFNDCLTISEMDSADCSWNLKGQFDERLIPYAAPNIVFIKEEENGSIKVVLLTAESRVLSYDVTDNSLEAICDLSARLEFMVSSRFQYIESLAHV